jgi:hypothetical protein
MAVVGLEPTRFSSGKSHVPPQKRAKSDVTGAREGFIERLLDVWPTLSDAAILEVVEHAERLARDENNAR